MNKKKLLREVKGDITEIKITLEFSIRLLEDYQGDLKIELR